MCSRVLGRHSGVSSFTRLVDIAIVEPAVCKKKKKVGFFWRQNNTRFLLNSWVLEYVFWISSQVGLQYYVTQGVASVSFCITVSQAPVVTNTETSKQKIW